MNHRIIWPATAAFLAALLGLTWWALSSRPGPVAMKRSAPPAPSRVPAAPPTPASRNLPEPDFNETPSHTVAAPSAHSFHWKTEVMPGDSVITDCYEGMPGEFVFSKLTPQVSQDEAGLPKIDIENDTFTMNFLGDKAALGDRPVSVSVAPGKETSTTYFADGGRYRVFVKATLGEDNRISLETHGDFTELPSGSEDN